MKKVKNWLNVFGLILITLLWIQGPIKDVQPYSITTAIDYTTDKIGKDSASIGAIKKLDVDRILTFQILTYLQENYYGSSEPDSPISGQIWYDSSAGYLKVYNGSTWSAVAAAAGITGLDEDTSPSLGGNLDLNQFNIVLDPTPTADHTWNGKTETQTAGENLVIGDVCYFKSDGKFWKCDADAEATSKGMIRMSTATIAANDTGVFLIDGYIRDDTWNWAAIGEEVYISVTPGNPTETAPVGDADIKRILGHAQSADILYFNPSQAYTEIEA
jgi:hypothetical protein